jgi:5-bromo-4-chloroindolyl phosphate hydrolysis protein
MKKSILTTLIAFSSLAAFSQQAKVDTTHKVNFTQTEIWYLHFQLNEAVQKLHKLDISALKRDSLDNLIMPWVQEIELRYNKAYLSDKKQPAKNEKPKN